MDKSSLHCFGLQYNTLRRRTPPGRAPVRHTAHLNHALAWFGSTISRAPFHAGGRTVERSAYRLKLVLIVHAAMVGQQLPCVLSEYAIPHDAFSRPGPRRAFCLHITPFPAVACFPLPKACACRARTCWGFLRPGLVATFRLVCRAPDRAAQGEQLDDVERLTDLQRAIRRNAVGFTVMGASLEAKEKARCGNTGPNQK